MLHPQVYPDIYMNSELTMHTINSVFLRHFPGNHYYSFCISLSFWNDTFSQDLPLAQFSSDLKYRFKKDNNVKTSALPELYGIRLSLAFSDFSGLRLSETKDSHNDYR